MYRKAYIVGFTFLMILVIGCDQSTNQLTEPAPLSKQLSTSAQQMNMQKPLNFRTHLSGRNEVPAVETRAQGQAIFHVDPSGESLSYKLIAANIENVLMAHIHLAAAEENGPVVLWLYPEGGPPPSEIEGRFNGVLAEGTVTADDLVGPLKDMTLENLLDEIMSSNAYVNVHTTQNPAGEIRGQIF